MKNFMKKSFLMVLVFVMVISCLPATTQAADKYKWSKSLTLKGKCYSTDAYAPYEVCIFSDRASILTVKTSTGCVSTYCNGGKEVWDPYYTAEYVKNVDKGNYSFWKQAADSDIGVDRKKLKKNKTYTVPVKRGFNRLEMRACFDVKMSIGQTYKCKVTSKDSNIILLSSGKVVYGNTTKDIFPTYKEFKSFIKWVGPQDESLCKWEVQKDYGCDVIAEHMINAGITNYDKYTIQNSKELATEIQKYVEDTVQKSKKAGGKIISHKEALENYINSFEGFEEKLDEYNKSCSYLYYWGEIQEILDDLTVE